MALVVAPTARDQGRYWEVPQDSYPKLEQAGVILTHAADPSDARTFLDFLKSDSARRTLRKYGFY
jgi:molybdate transport system substrate-binding protein